MKKKIIATSILTISLLSSTNSHASGIPTFDAAMNAILTNQYVQDAMQHAEDIALKIEQMAQDSMLNLAKITNDNNLAAAQMAREGQLAVDMHNMENAKDLTPIDQCNTVSTAVHIAQNECEVTAYRDAKMSDPGDAAALQRAIDEAQAEGAPIEQLKIGTGLVREKQVSALVQYCRDAIANIGEDGAVSNPCASAGLIAGLTDQKTLTDTELEAVEKTIELIMLGSAGAESPAMSPFTEEDDLAYYKRQAFKSFVYSSLYDLVGMHKNLDGSLSVMGSLDEMIKKETTTQDGVIDAEKINSGPTSGAIKYTAKAMRMLIYMQNLQIQQNNKIQALMAADLALTLDGK